MRLLAAALAFAGLFAAAAHAEGVVTIGAVYPLASDAKAAIEIGVDIVNAPHPGLDTVPLGAGEGLPNWDNAKLAVVFTDDQGNPSVARSQVLRLIEQNHVAALIGGGEGPATLAETAEADRHGIPFLVPNATEPKITGRGLAWVFRTGPLGGDFIKAYIQFLIAQKAAGAKVNSIGLFYEWTDRGKAEAALLRDAAEAAGLSIFPELGYTPGSTDLSAVVMGMRAGNPDVVIVFSNAEDAGLLVRTMNTVGYKPPLLIGDDDGFSDPGFVSANGNLAQGLIDRSVWSVGDANSPSAIVNGLYKAKTGHDLDDAGARALQGFLVLADAINRAGSTEPAAIQQALRETDLKPDQLIVGYDGVKFDASGQNTLAGTYLTQLRGKGYVAVWPAERAPAKLALPYKAWQQ